MLLCSNIILIKNPFFHFVYGQIFIALYSKECFAFEIWNSKVNLCFWPILLLKFLHFLTNIFKTGHSALLNSVRIEWIRDHLRVSLSDALRQDKWGQGRQKGSGRGAAAPQFFEIFTHFPWNSTPKTVKIRWFLMFCPPVFGLPPSFREVVTPLKC